MQVIRHVKAALCEKNQEVFKLNKAGKMEQLIKTESKLNKRGEEIGKLSTGQWVTLAPQEQARILKIDADRRKKRQYDISDFLFQAVGASGLVGKSWTEKMADVRFILDGQFEQLLGGLLEVPFIGPAIKSIGGVTLMKTALFTAMKGSGSPVFTKLIHQAQRANEIVKFYYEITDDCPPQGLIDGRSFGGDAFSLTNQQAQLGYAFEKMMANVPFYALMALQHDGKHFPPRIFDIDTYDERIDHLFRTTFIANSEGTTVLTEELNADRLRHKRFLESHATIRIEMGDYSVEIPWGVNAVWDYVSDLADKRRWDGQESSLGEMKNDAVADNSTLDNVTGYLAGALGGASAAASMYLMTTYAAGSISTLIGTAVGTAAVAVGAPVAAAGMAIAGVTSLAVGVYTYTTVKESTATGKADVFSGNTYSLLDVLEKDRGRGTLFRAEFERYYNMFINHKNLKAHHMKSHSTCGDMCGTARDLDRKQHMAIESISSIRPPTMLGDNFFAQTKNFGEINEHLLKMTDAYYYIDEDKQHFYNGDILLAYIKFRPERAF
jgi:hypothetical protein